MRERIKQNTDADVITLATASALLSSFSSEFDRAITAEAQSADVAGFKSVACYRTGLDVSPVPASLEEIEEARAAERAERSADHAADDDAARRPEGGGRSRG